MQNTSLSVLWLMLILVLPGCTAAKTATEKLGEIDHPKEEFRGAWLTSISNLDWPSSNTQSAEEQKADAVAMLDSLKAIGINAILFQVRAESDALYASSYDPWSYWLTGEQGRAPDPFYDPLSFLIREAHLRGMELHAWLNPYRVERQKGRYDLAGSNVSRREPGWILEFKTSPDTFYTMLDPGLPEVRDYVTGVVVDIIRRYDVDGIHFDDYFYPYQPVTNEDEFTFRKHHNHISDIKDWRRDNVNRLIAQVHDSIQAVAPHVSFGVSPFAIRKNEDADTRGLEGYHQLYADGLSWLENRTIDYINPQLYFEIGNPWADYSRLLTFWAKAANDNQRHMYAGLALYKLNEPANWTLDQAVDQLSFNMDNGMVHGNIFFRTGHLLANLKGYTDVVRNDLHRYPARTPVMPWKSMLPPPKVGLINASWSGDGRVILTWAENRPAQDVAKAVRYAVYRIDESSGLFDQIAEAGIPDSHYLAAALQPSASGEIHLATTGEMQPVASEEIQLAATGGMHLPASGEIPAHESLAGSGEMPVSTGMHLPNALREEMLRARYMIDITGQMQYADRWPEHRTEAFYIVTSLSHNSVESEPVILRATRNGEGFSFSEFKSVSR